MYQSEGELSCASVTNNSLFLSHLRDSLNKVLLDAKTEAFSVCLWYIIGFEMAEYNFNYISTEYTLSEV